MKFFYLGAGVLLALGIFLLLCDLAGVPTRRLSNAVRKVLKGKRQPQGDAFAGVIDRLAKLLASEAGGRKAVGSRRFYAVINQVDTDERTALARQTAELLKKQYGVPCVLTHFEEGERA